MMVLFSPLRRSIAWLWLGFVANEGVRVVKCFEIIECMKPAAIIKAYSHLPFRGSRVV
jgi:hypothetical protein